MIRPSVRFVPDAAVSAHRHEDVTVLTSARTGERHVLSDTGVEIWSLLQAERHTLDRLVMALARRSTGHGLADIPDTVREQLDKLVSRGLVERIASA